jgi:hypothetical protein
MLHSSTAYFATAPVGAAALPGGAGQVRRDRVDQTGVRVTGHQEGAGQAAGNQIGEERVPRLLRLAGRDLDPKNFAVPVRVDAGGDQHDGVDDAALLADLHGQRVGGHERERPGFAQRPGPKRRDLGVEVGGHPRDLRLRQAGDAQGLNEFVHPAGGHAEQVAGRDHADQGGLGALAAFQQPVREVRARA